MAGSIVIINYGMGNLGSIYSMLKYLDISSEITDNHDKILKAEKIIIAGVGAFENGIKNFTRLNLLDILNEKVIKEKIPVLGICLGMQLMTKKSEEGNLPGLAWFDAETVKFRFANQSQKFKVPHMGWNLVSKSKESKLTEHLPAHARFYFVHSFHVVCKNDNDVLLKTNYGYDFASAIQKENIFGVQFHPEKSHRFGMQILRNFAQL